MTETKDVTKQEEIKEGIKTILKERYGENWIHGKVALQIIHTLHLQGIVGDSEADERIEDCSLMKQELEIYTKKVTCGNCGEETELEIPEGETVTNFMVRTKCPNCGVFLQQPYGYSTPSQWSYTPPTYTSPEPIFSPSPSWDPFYLTPNTTYSPINY